MVDMSQATLLDLLGRRWHLGSAVEHIAIDASGIVAFTLVGGRIALAPLDDPDPPAQRYHVAGDNGRATITPRRKAPLPLTSVETGSTAVRVAAFARAGFLIGTIDGGLFRLLPDATLGALPHGDGPIRALVPASGNAVLVVTDSTLAFWEAGPDGQESFRWRRENNRGRAPDAIAVSADGRWLATAADGSILISQTGMDNSTGTRVDDLQVSRLSWSRDGRWLAAALATGGIAVGRWNGATLGPMVCLPDYPAAVRTLSWDANSHVLATDGAFRIVVWPVERLATPGVHPQSLPTGRGGLVAVNNVAIHPALPLIAASFENGMLVVAKIEGRDELVVRLPQAGLLRDLQWSRDGAQLAFATDEGEAALVSFPPRMFK